MDISTIPGVGVNEAGSGVPAERGVNSDKEAFLKLLVAQVSQQDPLSPQDSDQYVQQLTQFSTLEQLMSLNKGVETLAVGQLSNNSQEALSFVGKSVVAKGDRLDYRNGERVELAYEAQGEPSSLTLVLRDAAGNEVRRVEVEPRQGIQRYRWDGRDDSGRLLPSGEYHLSVEAKDGDGAPMPVQTYVRGEVTGVRFDQGYPELMIGDRRVVLQDVVEVK